MPRQQLLTEALRQRFAELGPQDHGDEGREIVVAHFFLPGTGWDWWPIAYDEDGGVPQLFCLVRGLEVELGYVSLAELEGARSPLGLGVERDEDWRECSLAELRRQLAPQRERWFPRVISPRDHETQQMETKGHGTMRGDRRRPDRGPER